MNRPLVWAAVGVVGAVLLVAAGWWAARLTSTPEVVLVQRPPVMDEHDPAIPGGDSVPPATLQEPAAVSPVPAPSLPDAPLSTLGQAFPHGFQWNTEVKAGDSVITDGYESVPGNYVFSKLTPQLKQDSAGNPEIEVQSEAFTMDFVGNKDTVFNLPMKLQPGVENSLLFGSPDGVYHLFVKATLNPGSSVISLETRGSFEEVEGQAPPPVAAPAQPDDLDN